MSPTNQADFVPTPPHLKNPEAAVVARRGRVFFMLDEDRVTYNSDGSNGVPARLVSFETPVPESGEITCLLQYANFELLEDPSDSWEANFCQQHGRPPRKGDLVKCYWFAFFQAYRRNSEPGCWAMLRI